jgi:hypothetical protein
MADHEVVLETAAFLESAPSQALLTSVPRANQKSIVERFLQCAFEELGKAPRLLDGQEIHELVGHLLPARFARRDPLGGAVPEVLRAYLKSLGERQVVPNAYEQQRSLEATLPQFGEAVATGVPHVHDRGPQQPFVHRAAKVGRNDPCPCGSGKKFKQCCARLGGA